MRQEITLLTGSRAASPALERRGVQNHEGFFAPYYLFELLERQHSEDLDPSGREASRYALKRLFRHFQRSLLTTQSTSFERTWTLWYKDMFKILGFPPLRRLEPLETARHGLVPISHACYEEAGAAPLILIDLHPFGTDLDRAHYSNFTQNPEITKEPISRAIEFALDYNQTRWALLSNGKEIRLYRRNSSVARQYLKVDFVELLERDQPKDWLIFWGLFRFAAFTSPDTAQSDSENSLFSRPRRCLLDRINEESQRHATKIADDLRENVVDALEKLLQGIIDAPQNFHLWMEQRHGKPSPNELQLKELFHESMYFLYRLLFILYAESRDLLPIAESEIYKETYSLDHLRVLSEKPLRSEDYDKTYYIDTIHTLFTILYKGYPVRNPKAEIIPGSRNTGANVAFHIPPYNGKLFHPDRTPLLDQCRVPDHAMREVIRELSLSRPKKRNERREHYSYSDLGIDQLGSIYEGLLVYEPSITEQTMVEARLKGELSLITLEQAEKLELPYDTSSIKSSGSFVLRTWGGRRKSSGSYYTPQEITAFLVKDALSPIIEPIIQGCAQRDKDGKRLRQAEEILKVKVCDPAMGSGAFLVQACRYLGDAYGRALALESGRENVRMTADNLAKYKRRVAETCLYGVDLNPLAVELAKVSLWLETLAQDRPLTFLDSHLRCGNALIGAPLRDESGNPDPGRLSVVPTEAFGKAGKEDTKEFKDMLRKLVAQNKKQVQQLNAGQLTLFSQDEQRKIFAAYERLRLQLEESDEGKNIEEAVALVHLKQLRFEEAIQDDKSNVRHFKDLCDLWCALWFWPADIAIPPPTSLLYRDLASIILQKHNEYIPDNTAAYLETARKIAEERHFFHWELEFPEIWYDEQGNLLPNGGFDVVVGNPPWDSIAPNSQEFWSNYIPTFRTLENQAAIRVAEKLRVDPEINKSWKKYRKFLEQQTNVFKLGKFFKKQGTGQFNTYKLFLEHITHLTRTEGIFSIVVPSGIYTDEGCTALRDHVFFHHKNRFTLSVENRKGIFPIENRFKVVLLSGQKNAYRIPESDTSSINCLFLVGKDSEGSDLALSRQDLALLLPRLEQYLLPVSTKTIKRLSPDTISLMEFKSKQEIRLSERIYGCHPLLKDQVEGSWNINLQNEFHMTKDSYLFNKTSSGGWPLCEGKMIYQFDSDYSPISYWVDKNRGIDEVARRFRLNTYSLSKEWQADRPKLGCTNFRLVYRDVARNTDEVTLIATILPPSTFIGNTLIEFVQWSFIPEPSPVWNKLFDETNKLFLASTLNSFVLNFIIRQKVSAHVSMFLLKQLPVPRIPADHPTSQALVPLAARLTCIDARFAPLWEEVARAHPDTMHTTWSPACTTRDISERAYLRAQIDAIVAHLYGLSTGDFAYILSTFPLLDREQPCLPGEQRSFITRDLALLTLFQLRQEKPPANIIQFFEEAGVSIGSSTGPIVNLTERVSLAINTLGAVAYQPGRRENNNDVEAEDLIKQTLFDFADE